MNTPSGAHQGNDLGLDDRAWNVLLIGPRSIGARADALLEERWKALRHFTFSPSKIGTVVAAVLVLTTLDRGTRCENLSSRIDSIEEISRLSFQLEQRP